MEGEKLLELLRKNQGREWAEEDLEELSGMGYALQKTKSGYCITRKEEFERIAGQRQRASHIPTLKLKTNGYETELALKRKLLKDLRENGIYDKNHLYHGTSQKDLEKMIDAKELPGIFASTQRELIKDDPDTFTRGALLFALDKTLPRLVILDSKKMEQGDFEDHYEFKGHHLDSIVAMYKL